MLAVTSAAISCMAFVPGAWGAFEAAPDPGGSERKAVSVPPPGKRLFGFHESAYEYSEHGWNARDVAAVAKGGGANTLRFTIDWLFVEPTRDVWDETRWNHHKRIYDAALAAGIRPHITVSTAPTWARDGLLPSLCGPGARPCEYPPSRAMNGEWVEFVREVARRFPRAGAIEIWNEPNLDEYYKPAPDPQRYAELVALAYPAIKAAAPRVNVLAGANAPAQDFEYDSLGTKTDWPIEDFMRAAYASSPSIKGNMDGISYHYLWPARGYGKGSRFADLVQDVRKVRNEFGDRGMGLWMSEFGLTTTGPYAVSHKEQADGLIRIYRRLMSMKDSRELIIHTLADRIETPRSERDYGYGLISSFDPFVPKPAYCAFAGRVRTSNPFGPCRRVREGLIHITSCTRALVRVEKSLSRASGKRLVQVKQAYRRLSRKCIPCKREVARLGRRIARLDSGPLRTKLIARRNRTRKRCVPCQSNLHAAAAVAAAASIVDRPSKLEAYERLRRRCRP